MELNIFKISRSEFGALRERLAEKGATVVHAESDNTWSSEFLFLEGEEQVAGWLRMYEPFFDGRELPTRRSQSAVYLFHSPTSCYAIAHGSGRFHVAPFCDYDFGIELAKRIADENDVGQTAAKRYQGSRRKEHRVYKANTRLDVTSGESVDFIRAAIIRSKQDAFGKTGKFGVSAILSPATITIYTIGNLLSSIEVELTNPELFSLPRTVLITEQSEVEYFDRLLVSEITTENGATEFASNSFDLSGVDFTFGRQGRFSLKYPGKRSLDFWDEHILSIEDLRSYIEQVGLGDDDILKIKVTAVDDYGNCIDVPLKKCLDYIADAERVVLSNGQWRHFNQDYLAFLNEYVRNIETEETEEPFKVIAASEPDFNDSRQLRNAGYKYADKDFSIAPIRAQTPVEAWDLHRGNTVYAVKFGTPQKLGYACDQAAALLKLASNRATIKQIPRFDRYCLWFGYSAKQLPENIADTNSVILKQKIEDWARLCREFGVTPVIKLSRHIKPNNQLKLF
ncbi:DUF6119 family protein [Nocardia grenadensis]|uniref:DUF6119 family protein n=1 Tax=Nocardia grenadensis TaxID=931537 RepID=UPI003D73EEAC